MILQWLIQIKIIIISFVYLIETLLFNCYLIETIAMITRLIILPVHLQEYEYSWQIESFQDLEID